MRLILSMAFYTWEKKEKYLLFSTEKCQLKNTQLDSNYSPNRKKKTILSENDPRAEHNYTSKMPV